MIKKLFFSLAVVGSINAHSASVEELDARLSEVEANQMLNIWTFGGHLVNRYDDIVYKDKNTSTNDYKQGMFKMRLALDMKADINKNTTFHGRLGMAKFWNGQGAVNYQNDSYRTFGHSSYYLGPEAYVDKAYVDYRLSDAMTLSLGRLPTFSGPPVHFHDARARMGTYPKMVYSAHLDGAAFGYKWNITEEQNLAFRVVYTPLHWVNRNNSVTNGAIPDDNTIIKNDGNEMRDYQKDVYALMADYNFEGGSGFDAINFIVQKVTYGLSIPNMPSFSGEGSTDGAYFEITNIADFKLDFAASYVMSTIKTEVDFLGTKEFKGNLTHVALKYQLPIQTKVFLGVEQNMASKEFSLQDTMREEPIDFYGMRGNGSHAFITTFVDSSTSIRIGHMTKEQKYMDPFRHYLASLQYPSLSNEENNTTTNTYVTVKTDF